MNATPKQIQLLDFIRAYIAENRISPTQREMGDSLGTHCGNINRMLACLEERGLVWRFNKGARGIRLQDGNCPHCGQIIGSTACRAAAAKPITYSTTPKQEMAA